MTVRTTLVYSILMIASLDALRCRVDDEPSEENLRKIARSCMRRIGNNDNDMNQYHRPNNRDQQRMRYGRNRRFSNGAQQNDRRYNRFMNQNMDGNSTDFNENYNQDRRNQNNRDCIAHCFFEELNMLNNDNYPDKHKVLYILTKNIRDHELNEFYTDAIQECFHLLDMEQRKDKCQFSKSLLNCMAEYARSNCEDWENHTIIFN